MASTDRPIHFHTLQGDPGQRPPHHETPGRKPPSHPSQTPDEPGVTVDLSPAAHRRLAQENTG